MNNILKELKKQLKADLEPSIVYTSLDNQALDAEKELINKYQTFSAELLRLSLLGIAAIGFIYTENLKHLSRASKHYAALSALFFGFSAIYAIFHRYLSSETLRYYIRGLQWQSKFLNDKAEIDRCSAKNCLKFRRKIMWGCMILKFLSASSLAIGAGCLAYAFIIPLW